MLRSRTTRAALLAGLSAAALLPGPAADANPMQDVASATAASGLQDRPRLRTYAINTLEPARRGRPAETTATGYIAIDATALRSRSVSKPKRATKSRKDAAVKPDKTPTIVPPGPLHIVVSINLQRAWLYANGELVASTKVSTGTKSHPTPMGLFTVIQKNRHHVSNLYYAPMPYMQRLTWSGTAMHTGPLPGYPASHGCIRLTDEFAQLLWKSTKIGARVVITRDEVRPVAFSHPRLFTPKLPDERTAGVPVPRVRTADATGAVPSAGVPSAPTPAEPDAAVTPGPDQDRPPSPTPAQSPAAETKAIERMAMAESMPSAREAERRNSPISIFISRKDGKLYVRQAMEPLFDLPVTFAHPEQPIGTHVFTAMEIKDGAMQWTAVSVPSSFASEVTRADKPGTKRKTARGETTGSAPEATPPSASAALDRIDMPKEALERLNGMMTPGSSLIVSDKGIGGETGKYTDFIVLTR